MADDRPFRDFTDDQLVLLALWGIRVTPLGNTATEEDAGLMARAMEFMVGAEIHARGLHPREHYRALARRAGEALQTHLRNVVPIEPERN